MITIKTDREIELMREPCKVVRDVLLLAGQTVKAGMTTGELDKVLHDYIISCGAKPSFLGLYGFPKSTCISINEEVVHGRPGDRIIKEGDRGSVDAGVYLNGFHGDAARSFCVGQIDPMKKKLVDVTKECFFKGIEGLRAGTPLFDIGYKVQKYAESFGYGVIRSYTGHGIGREMHEDPSIPNYGKAGTGVRLKAGTVLCIEPMISMGNWRVKTLPDGWGAVTIDGKPAAHYENTVVVREDGVEILTL